jgi:hypothetical protein
MRGSAVEVATELDAKPDRDSQKPLVIYRAQP